MTLIVEGKEGRDGIASTDTKVLEGSGENLIFQLRDLTRRGWRIEKIKVVGELEP